MGIHGMLLQVMLVGLVLATTVAPTTAQAKLGCPGTCGNLNIPYPFGTKEGCYLNEDFLISCNPSDNTFIPYYLKKGNVIVTNISVEGQMQISQLMVGRDCYNQNGTQVRTQQQFRLLSKFTISSTQNKFVAVGCDTNAIIRGYRGMNESYETGCISTCNNYDHINDICFGAGCCQIYIPKGLRGISVELSSYNKNNHSNVWHFNPCSYAFVVEEKAFNFSKNYLRGIPDTEELPVVLDWTIGNETCEVARKNQTYACKGNSTCHENGSGYLCQCWEGYQGNPYLDGCQDIDECSSHNRCEKPEYCVNEVGNYTCSCPKGYIGDGRKDGKGCIANANPLKVILVALGASIGGGLSFLLLLLGGFWLYKVIKKRKNIKLKEKFFNKNGGMLLQQQMSSDEGAVEKIKIFTSKELEKASDNFNENRILGQGGQGTVYKGMLIDGRIVAIKKSKLVDESQLEQFINEVVILSQINHRNIVKLLGCCLETEVPLLVYEFISNGTLFQIIHDQNEKFPLSWELRLQISTEVSGALAYLHSSSSIPIYHRDVKSTNILLDDKYRAKVSDFGTSRSIPINQTHLTTLVQGTFGYLDPEYFQSSQLTEKSDVYSFGVVLVELLTGQKPISSIRSQEVKSLATHFILSLEETRLFDILDPRVIKEGGKEEIMAAANLAKRCLNLNGKKRPTMKEVTMELERIRMSNMPLTAQQNFLEGECSVEIKGPSDGDSTSTGEYLDYTKAFSLDVHPLLYSTI